MMNKDEIIELFDKIADAEREIRKHCDVVEYKNWAGETVRRVYIYDEEAHGNAD